MAHDTSVRSHLASTSNDEQLVGRRAEIAHARVGPMAGGNDFWISGTGNERLFVLPSDQMQAQICAGPEREHHRRGAPAAKRDEGPHRRPYGRRGHLRVREPNRAGKGPAEVSAGHKAVASIANRCVRGVE
jgi:hypothetical protein